MSGGAASVLEIRHLRLVCAIVDEGGPTRAGTRLHLSQSAVSHQLAELERRLGVVLFTRVRRRLQLTPAGKHLVEFARSTLDRLARAERELLVVGARERRRLRVSTECFTGYHWLPKILPELRRDFPDVDVQIVIEATRRPVAALLKRRLELAIVSSTVQDQELTVEPLFSDEWVVILPPSHPLVERSFVRPADLANLTVFAHHASAQDAKRMKDLLATEDVTISDLQVVPLTEAIAELVKADLGVGLMSGWSVAPYEASGQIVTRRFTKAGLKEHWCAAYRRDAADHLPLARFAELLRALAPVPAPGR